MNKQLFTTSLGWLRTIGFLEGLSYLVLLGIAMPLKYYTNEPGAVKHVGMAHGVLFIAYVLLLALNTLQKKWSFSKALWGFLASLIPFGTFYADIKLYR